MPPACPGEFHVGRYKGGYIESSSFPFPSGGSAAGERARGCGERSCVSNERNHPPGKPGAFADASTDCISQRYDQGPTERPASCRIPAGHGVRRVGGCRRSGARCQERRGGPRLNREFARLDKRERELAEVQSELERQQQLSATVVVLWNELSQARDGNVKLRDQLARVQQQNQRLQDEHRQSVVAARNSEREVVVLKADLVQERATVARLTRESQAPVSPVRESRVAHVDQTPRPMAPYGYWASPSGYRYGGRW
jgi:hypothetical protein